MGAAFAADIARSLTGDKIYSMELKIIMNTFGKYTVLSLVLLSCPGLIQPLIQPLAAGEVEVVFSNGFESITTRITGVDYDVIAHGGRLQITGVDLDLVIEVKIGGVVLDDFTIDDPETIIINHVADEVPVGNQGLVVTTAEGNSAPFSVTVIHLLISELEADSPSADLHEFIEISTALNTPVSLDGYVVALFNGGTANEDTYAVFDLGDGGMTSPEGLMLIGTALLNHAPDILMDTETIQNGEDAVAIYQFPEDVSTFPLGFPDVGTDGLIDAVIHETGDDPDRPDLAPLLLAGGAFDEGINTAARETASIQRCDRLAARRDTTFMLREVPTPGLTNLDCNGPQTLANCTVDFNTCPNTGQPLCGALIVDHAGNALCETPPVADCSAAGNGFGSVDPDPRVDIYLTGNLNSLSTFLAPFMGNSASMRFFDIDGNELGTELEVTTDCDLLTPPLASFGDLGAGEIRRILVTGDGDVWIDNLEVNP